MTAQRGHPMARTFRLLPAGIEEAQFKKVPEGWLFTTVNPWFFAPRRTYLATDAQKAPIVARVRRARYIRLMLLVPALAPLAAAFVMVPSSADIHSLTTWLILGAFTVVLLVAMAVSEHLALRPLLRDMPRSSQKIGSLEMLQRQGQAMSVTVLVMVTLLFAISAVAYTYLAFAAAPISRSLTQSSRRMSRFGYRRRVTGSRSRSKRSERSSAPATFQMAKNTSIHFMDRPSLLQNNTEPFGRNKFKCFLI